ncbi:MAG: hypothetical protein AAFN41_06850 [Planctomycetota bacterium]
MSRDRVIQIIAAVVLLVCLAGSGLVGATITESVGTNKLVYADSAAENDGPEVSLGIAMGAFRGIFVNFLWYRANELKEDGKYHEAIELSKAITKLQPRFPRVWVFHAWNLAYNISVTTQTAPERWRWVQSGVRLLRDEALRANPNDMLIHKELAYIFLHKMQGITDDANQYYKRKVAEEWTSILGPPPPAGPETRTREGAMETYAAWMRVVADAADTFEEAVRREPKVEELRDLLRGLYGTESAADTLRRYAIHDELHRRGLADDELGGILGLERARDLRRLTVLTQLKHDPAFENAWTEYIAHLRKRVIIDNYNMDPDRMARYTEMYGPLDWRHPASHSLYWARTGVERGLGRFEDRNKKDYDFVNTDRMTTHSIQELFRYGEVYFDFLEFVKGDYAYYLAVPNPRFIDAYTDILDEVVGRAGEYAEASDPYNTFAAGYANFIADAILMLYRRGDRAEAERYRQHLITWPGLNFNDWTLKERLKNPLEEFVEEEMQFRLTSPQVYATQVAGALQGAFSSGLLAGDDQLFREQYDWARQYHKYYIDEQLRTMNAGGSYARMEVLPRDFRILAGGMFARFIGPLSVEEKQDLYVRAPNELRLFAYIMLEREMRESIDEQAEETGEPDFDTLFPQPENYEAFLAELEARGTDRQLDLDIRQK